jgi:DNA polymerase-3 subunit gamma/tau
MDEGYDLVEFYHGLLDVLRILLRLRLSPDAEVDVREDLRAALLERAEGFEPGDLVRMLQAAAELESQGSLRRSPNPRLTIEMLLLRLSYLDRTVSLEELLRALGGAPPPERGSGGDPGGGTAKGVGRVAAPTRSRAGRGTAAPSASSGASAPVASSAPPAPSTEPAATAEPAPAAWNHWLEAGRTVPKGLMAFLRSATVSEDPDGRVHISSLAAPAAERLAEPATLRAVREGLAPHLGRLPELVVDGRAREAGPSARVSEAEVREHALQALYRQEPRLERAVEELDLELMD